MKRFMGMMPSSEVKKQKRFDTGNGMIATIQAGEKGWTILFADSSSEHKNIEDTTENNFNSALKQLNKYFISINPV